jgi:hypothetical protein
MHWTQLSALETWITGGFAAGIWLAYAWTSGRRMDWKEAVFRSALLGVALLCLCLIIWKPQYSVQRPAGSALLLTENTTSIPDSVPVFALASVSAPEKARKVADISTIERNHLEIERLYVSGYNLAPEQLKPVMRIEIIPLETESPAGFSWLDYTRRVRENERLTVSGTYLNNSGDTLTLSLVTAEGIQDSVRLASGRQAFTLRAQPRVAGTFIANLQVKRGDSLRTEPLPYRVVAHKSLSIVMLQAFPTFEMNYLKDWLAGQGHRLQVRARISRDNYYTQRINPAPESGERPILSEANLNAADLLILDAESLRQLPAAEQRRLQTAIRAGLGIALLPDQNWLRRPELFSRRFALSATGAAQFLPENVPSTAQTAAKAEKWPAAFTPAGNPLLIPVLRSVAGEVVAAYVPEGSGRLGVQLAAETYPWILRGEGEVYSHFWTYIIQTLSRRQTDAEIRVAGLPFIWENYLATITLSDTTLRPLTIRYASGNSQVIRPEKPLLDGFSTHYPLQPPEAGWLETWAGEDTSQTGSEYVMPAGTWTDLQRAAWWRENQHQLSTRDKNPPQTYTDQRDIPMLWFFIPFLASVALVWWREKAATMRNQTGTFRKNRQVV